jgi:NAD(P)-dependent dehydrogenase (short-subunit alcohol dehydrogenase family)
MRTALITGGSRGIGAAIVRGLARKGWRVAFCYKSSEAAAQQLARETGALPIPCDVTRSEEVRKMVETAARQLGHIDLLVNNAGVAWQGLLSDMTDADWHTVLDTSLSAAFYACRETIPGMVSRKSGRIINISSMNSFRPLTKIPAYSGAKAAVSNFTQWLAVHFSKVGIRVNAIAPGFFVTNQNQALLINPDGTYTERSQKILAHTPMNRFGTADDLTGTLLWLCDNGASGFVNGVVVPVDGGFAAYSGV